MNHSAPENTTIDKHARARRWAKAIIAIRKKIEARCAELNKDAA